MTDGAQSGSMNFTVDKTSLYREESVTDLKVASIKKLTPILPDGSDDDTREPVFFGSAQLNTPHGPIPVQVKLSADTLEKAMDLFPAAMEVEVQKVVENIKRLQEQQKQAADSRIIMPGGPN